MPKNRIFDSQNHFELTDSEPIRSVVSTSTDARYVMAGQSIKPYRHPCGQDRWTPLSGENYYVINEKGTEANVKTGGIVIPHTSEVHGLHNRSANPIYFISVVS